MGWSRASEAQQGLPAALPRPAAVLSPFFVIMLYTSLAVAAISDPAGPIGLPVPPRAGLGRALLRGHVGTNLVMATAQGNECLLVADARSSAARCGRSNEVPPGAGAPRRRASRCWRSETENVGNKDYFDVSDPLKGEAFRQMPNTMEDEVNAFSVSAEACPKRGL